MPGPRRGLQLNPRLELKGWTITDHSILTKGPDHTVIYTFRATKPGHDLTVTEAYGDWYLTMLSGDKERLEYKDLNEYLTELGAPTVDEVAQAWRDQLDAEEAADPFHGHDPYYGGE